MKTVVDNGITVAFFEDEDNADVFTWVLEHWAEYGKVPALDTLQAKFDWDPCAVDETLIYYVDELREARRYAITHEGFLEAHKLLKDRKTKEAISLLGNAITQAALEVSALRDIDLHDGWEEWFDSYMDSPETDGIPTGFPTIDMATGGYRPENLITIIGTPKAGKSTLLLALANAAVLYGKRVMFVSFEMSAIEQQERYYAMVGQVDYEGLRQKKLGRADTLRLKTALRQRDAYPPFIMATDITAGVTVAALQAKVQQYNPDIVIVDGVYLMDSGVPDVSDMDPKALTALTRDLKRMAQRLRKPVVISHQALESRYSRKAGLRSKDVGYSSSFAQDSDTMIGIEWVGESEDDATRRISIMLARNAVNRSARIDWDWTTSTFLEMEGVEEVDPDDIGDPADVE